MREKGKILQDDNSVKICLIVVDNDGEEVTWRRKKEQANGKIEFVPNERHKVILDGKFPIVADFVTKKLHAVCRMHVKAWLRMYTFYFLPLVYNTLEHRIHASSSVNSTLNLHQCRRTTAIWKSHPPTMYFTSNNRLISRHPALPSSPSR